MSTNSGAAATPMERELTITRIFNAPRELVYQAWTDPGHLRIWWGPHGFSNPECEIDVRPGGKWRILMRGPGYEAPCGGEYIEVVENERLVFTNNAYSPDGTVLLEGRTSVTFADEDGKTKLTLSTRAIGRVPFAAQMMAGMEMGWSQSLERLEMQVSPGSASGLGSSTADRELVLSRVFDAPRDLVFEAWTNPKHVGKWWGPKGFTTTTHNIDLRPGGEWRFIMHAPDGTDYENHIAYNEIVKPERIVYTHGPAPWFQSTVTFAEQAGKTKITMRTVFASSEMRNNIAKYAVEGGFEHLGCLAEFLGDKYQPMAIALPSEREIILRRVFHAPRALVFEMLTKCEHLKRWWGPRSCPLVECEMDARPGGTWRYVSQMADGTRAYFKGTYHQIVPPETIVATECFDEPRLGSPEWLATVTLTEKDGRTTLTSRIEHPSQQARDGHLGSGMEWGAAETFDRLAELLAQTK
ncbi:MAG: SRPBCC domain-containing protein [Bryobacteraceae bacterium]